MRDIDEEESWIKEKKLLVSSDDYGMLSHDLFALKKLLGRDLVGVQNLQRKHRRLDNELALHKVLEILSSQQNISTNFLATSRAN